ncbi:major facilitator superfamily domain-containing protein [Halteromyces radiatus]|uniref:major facilitator superfamily domain-containing protein n=1 Tax=Halteromyces radiatus TaxID=101107 RepID=UPI00221E571E|nr:major facilitator superfamily domain-containing protein [Halteromyces radiatus]KAI8086267.1 major facilitator superfamily domain-containing protein [Halteromyces radiatus]
MGMEHSEKTAYDSEVDNALKYEQTHITSDYDQSEQQTTQNDSDAIFAKASWQYKLVALCTALLLPLGSHFSSSALSALKKPIKAHLGIDNAKYGVLSSSVSIINTVFPILGGLFIDMFGSVWGTLVVNILVILGSLLTAIAAKYSSFPLMIVGRVVFGIGSGLIVTMQESLLSKWFRTNNLAVAIGLQLSISRLATFLGTLVANPIASATNDWVWPFWLSFILCGFSILMNVIYALIVKRLRGEFTASKAELDKLKAKKTFHWRSVLKFPALYWLIILIEFLYAAVWSSFQTISTEFINLHFHTTENLAGYQASASQVVPIVATPLLGIFMDVIGLRIIVLLGSAIFLILSTVLLGWTYVNAVVGMVFYSFSLALGPIAMITSIGMILPSDYIGTGLGIYKSSNNIGTTILDIVVGVVQDNTANQAYTGVMILFLCLACVGFLLISFLWIAQRVWYQNALEAGRKKRQAYMQEKNDREIELAKNGQDAYDDDAFPRLGLLSVTIFIAAFIVAWVLFFVYALSGNVDA